MMTVALDCAEGDYIDRCSAVIQRSMPLSVRVSPSLSACMCVHTLVGVRQHVREDIGSLLDRQFGDKFVKGLKERSLLLPPISCLAVGIHGN